MFSGLRPTTVMLAASARSAPRSGSRPQATATRHPATTYAAAAFRATNAQRVDHDRVRLKKATCLTRMAQRWARHMARTGRLVHQDLGPIAARCDVSSVGENIAVGYPQRHARS